MTEAPCPTRTRRFNPAIRCLSFGVLLAAAASCLLRVAYLQTASDGTTATFRRMMVEHGLLVVELEKYPSQNGQARPVQRILNYQLQPGLSWSWQLNRSGAQLELNLPLALGLVLVGATGLYLTRRGHPRPGHCHCGYSLIGISADVCPECGRAIQGQ